MSYNRNSSYLSTCDISEINDYLTWSIINLFFGYGLFGIIPIIFSIMCRSYKQNKNSIGAENMSTLALFFNIIITIAGIIAWTILIIYISIYMTALQSLT